MRSAGAPSDRRFDHFRCEEVTITNVNHNTYTITAETRHTSKIIDDIQVLSPYAHNNNGEGIHHMP